MKSLKATNFLALSSACLLVGALTAQSRDQIGDPGRGSSEIHAASKDQIPSGSKEPAKASASYFGAGASETYDGSKDALGQRSSATIRPNGGSGQGSGDVLNASKDTAPASPSQEPIGEDLPPGAQLSMEREGSLVTFRVSGHGSSQGITLAAVLLSNDSWLCEPAPMLPPLLCNGVVLAAGIANPGFSASMEEPRNYEAQLFAQGLLADSEMVHATQVMQVEADAGKK